MDKKLVIAKRIAIGSAGILSAIALRQAVVPHQSYKMIRGFNNGDEIVFNKENIHWMRNVDGCFYVCTNGDGCYKSINLIDKYKVCKDKLPKSYKALEHLIIDDTS